MIWLSSGMDPNSEAFQTKIENEFSCRRCNECCKKPGFVYLQPGEAASIAEHLGLNEFEFVNQFCELQDRQKLVLKKLSNEHCIFLEDAGCRIHAAKPVQCREFPYRWRTPASLDYCEGLKALKS